MVALLRTLKRHWVYARKKKARLKLFPTSDIAASACIDNAVLEGENVICDGTDISGSEVGFATVIGSKSALQHSKVGRFCSISWNVRVSNATHPLDMVSTYPGFYNTCNRYPFGKGKAFRTEFLKTEKGYAVEIGNDVWIGEGALIKGGITIGDGAVVGMNAVVTKDVPPYAVVGGVPSKIIKYRLKPSEIEQMLSINWWNWPIDLIRSRREDFSDPALFLKKYGQ